MPCKSAGHLPCGLVSEYQYSKTCCKIRIQNGRIKNNFGVYKSFSQSITTNSLLTVTKAIPNACKFAHKNQKYITEFKSELSNKKFSIYQISLDENPRMAWNEQTLLKAFRGVYRGASSLAKMQYMAMEVVIFHILSARNCWVFENEEQRVDDIFWKIQIFVHRCMIFLVVC